MKLASLIAVALLVVALAEGGVALSQQLTAARTGTSVLAGLEDEGGFGREDGARGLYRSTEDHEDEDEDEDDD